MKQKFKHTAVICLLICTIITGAVPIQAAKPRYITQNQLKLQTRRSSFSSDEFYANYRNVVMGNIIEKKLYRGIIPYQYSRKKYNYLEKFMKRDNIQAVINLSGYSISKHIKKKKTPYYYTLWKRGNVKELPSKLVLGNAKFKKQIAKGLKFMSRKKGPYYVHCLAGRDRTGYFCALLECYMGASYTEVVNDYMESYTERYGKLSKAQLNKIKKQTIVQILREISSSNKPQSVDLQKRSAKFMRSIGVTKKEQDRIYQNLAY